MELGTKLYKHIIAVGNKLHSNIQASFCMLGVHCIAARVWLCDDYIIMIIIPLITKLRFGKKLCYVGVYCIAARLGVCDQTSTRSKMIMETAFPPAIPVRGSCFSMFTI